MPASSRQRGFLHQRFFSLQRQIDVGNLTGCPAACNRSLALRSYGPAKLEIRREITENAYGAGREFPYRTDDARIDLTLADQMDLTPLAAGWIAAFALGEVSTSGASAPYTHTLTVQPGIDLPVTAVVEKLPGGLVLYPDLHVADFSLSGSGSAESMIQLACNWKGSGRWDADPATFAGFVEPPLSRSSYLRMGGISLAIGPWGAESPAHTANLTRFDYRYANNPFDGHRPGSGLVGAYAEAGARRAHALTFEVMRDAAETFLAWYRDKARLSLALTMKADDWPVSGQQVEIRIPQMEIVRCDPAGEETQLLAIETAVLFDPDAPGYSAANRSGAWIAVKNGEPALLSVMS